MNTTNQIATRKSIAVYFKTDELTTHRILMNLNYGFFKSHFGNDADSKWNEAHPFYYPNNIYRDFTSISLAFIAKYFDLFSTKQFYTTAGWKYNETTNRMDYSYDSGYVDVK